MTRSSLLLCLLLPACGAPRDGAAAPSGDAAAKRASATWSAAVGEELMGATYRFVATGRGQLTAANPAHGFMARLDGQGMRLDLGGADHEQIGLRLVAPPPGPAE